MLYGEKTAFSFLENAFVLSHFNVLYPARNNLPAADVIFNGAYANISKKNAFLVTLLFNEPPSQDNRKFSVIIFDYSAG